MRRSILVLVALYFVTSFLFGCAGGDLPVSPNLPVAQNPETGLTHHQDGENRDVQTPSDLVGIHNLWNYSLVFIDTENMDYEIIPARIASEHWNILGWLENWPCTNCFKITGMTPSGTGTLLIDIEIKHPFDNPNLTGFDVRGIAMFNGSGSFPLSGLTYSDRSLGDGELVNADGYTTLYNPSTAGSGPGGLQGYLKGKFATALLPNSNLNAFKRFISDDPANARNAFYAGDKVTVTYEVDMPDGPFVFGYAVDANWTKATTLPVTNPMTDFPVEANCPEPWNLDGTSTPVSITVTLCEATALWWSDNASWSPALGIECPDLADGYFMGDITLNTSGKTEWDCYLMNLKGAVPGLYKALLKVSSNQNDPVNKPWLDLSAYRIITVEVAENVPPTACAEADSNTIKICKTLHFDASCSFDNDGNIVSWLWDDNNDGVYDKSGKQINLSWAETGTVTVDLKVIDNGGKEDKLNEPINIEIENGLPIPSAEASKINCVIDEEIQFDGSGSVDGDCGGNSIVDWEWDWENDDELDETGDIVTHAYTTAGVYEVQLRVTDNEGASAVLDTLLTINVSEQPQPFAVASADPNPQTVCKDIEFIDGGSDGGGEAITEVAWDWNNDGLYEIFGSPTNTYLHSWDVPGIYYVQYKVTNAIGQTDELDEPLEVTIENALPTAFSWSPVAEAFVDEEILWDGSDSHDNDCGNQSIVEWEWDWENDGIFDDTGETALHAWVEPGNYEIQLRVTDDEGGTDVLDSPLLITINDYQPPIAYATAAPNPQTVCEYITFSDNGSYDPDGGLIVLYEWDYGANGTYEDTGETVQALLDVIATVPVQLRVTDDEGMTDILDVSIQASWINALPTAAGFVTEEDPYPNQPFYFYSIGSSDNDCGGDEIVESQWDWENDGIWDYVTSDNYMAHSWPDPGTYYVNLRVKDDEGGFDTVDAPFEVNVVSTPKPTAKATAIPNPQTVCESVQLKDDGSLGGGGAITLREWDVNNDGIYEYTGFQIYQTWNTPGTYYVQYRVTNEWDATDTLDQPLQVVIQNALPTAVMSADNNFPVVGQQVTFFGDQSHDNDCGNESIVKWEWDWNGDGVYDETKFTPNTTHTFNSSGSYTVQLRVTDNEGGTDTLDFAPWFIVFEGWARTWGSTDADMAYATHVDLLNNIYVGGSFTGTVDFDPSVGIAQRTSNGGTDAFIAKYNNFGVFQWVKTWGGSGTDAVTAVAAYDNNNVFAVGYFEGTNVNFNPDGSAPKSSNGGFDAFVNKFNSSGAHQWIGTWGGTGSDSANSIAIDDTPNMYIAGIFEGTVDFNPFTGTANRTSNGQSDAYVINLGNAGTFSWANAWGSTGYDGAQGVSYANSYVYLTGVFVGTVDFDQGAPVMDQTSHGGQDIFFVKYNASNGAYGLSWALGGTGNDSGYSIFAERNSSNQYIYLTGEFRNTVDFCPFGWTDNKTSNGGSDVFIVRFTPNGDYYNAQSWGGTGDDVGRGVYGNLLGNSITVIGDFNGVVDLDPSGGTNIWNSQGGTDVFLSKFDSSYNMQWGVAWGAGSNDNGYFLSLDSLGKIYCAGGFQGSVDFNPGPGGATHDSAGGSDAFLAMHPSDGTW